MSQLRAHRKTRVEKMEITDIEEQRIYSYIHCQMTAEEEAAFKAELANNPDLRQKAALLARLTKAMNEVGTERDHALIDALSTSDRRNMPSLSQVRKKHSAFRWLGRTAAAAAMVLMVIGVRWGVNRHHLTTLGQEYATQFELTEEVRGEMEPYEAELAALYKDIINGQNLDATIDRLHVLYEVSILDEENRYTEHSFLIGWSLACGYLQQGDRQAAISQLERLNDHGFDKPICADKVRELLEKIR